MYTDTFELRYSDYKDFDTNMHLNNQKSAELLMDALPFEYTFDDIRIIYKKPALLGEELDVCMQKIQNGYYVHLAASDGEICVAGTFEKENGKCWELL